MSITPPAKQKDWMHSLADFMIMHPYTTNVEIAKAFGVSAVWIGVVKRSDSFQELLKARREVHANMVSQSVISKVEALAEQAVDEMSSRLQKEVVPLEQVKEIGDLALKALGFGVKNATNAGAPVTNNITVTVEREALAAAREKMKLINGSVTGTVKQIEGEVVHDDQTQSSS